LAYGYTPSEALRCATGNGGAMMTMGSDEKQGQLKEGYLADMVLVDGDPLTDLSVLLNPERLVMIMKGGELYKNVAGAAQRRAAA